MAVLQLQLDIDSEVHPELHGTLSSIGSSLSQAERLRQLAATGLVWERLRLQAYGRIEVPDLGPASAPAPASGTALPASLPDQAPVPTPQAAVPRLDATAAQRHDLTDFVDLSDAVVLGHLADPDPGHGDERPPEHHDADHDAVSAETVDKAVHIAAARLLPRGDAPELLPLHEIRSAVQALPVLTEVVGAAELPNMDAIAATTNEATPAAVHAGLGSTMPTSTGAQIHELAPARKTATRSRLMRMKDKGLFKNE